jgi:hypothetical protein
MIIVRKRACSIPKPSRGRFYRRWRSFANRSSFNAEDTIYILWMKTQKMRIFWTLSKRQNRSKNKDWTSMQYRKLISLILRQILHPNAAANASYIIRIASQKAKI